MHFVSSKVLSPSCYIGIMEIAPQNKVIEIEEDTNIDIEMNEEINEQEQMDEDHVLLNDSCFESNMEDDVTELIYHRFKSSKLIP